MKKILIISLVAGLALFTSCTYRSERDDATGYYNTLYSGRVYHNQIVLFNQNEKILENQELIIKQNEEILKALNEKN